MMVHALIQGSVAMVECTVLVQGHDRGPAEAGIADRWSPLRFF
jgi:hypothetical protein